MSEVPPLSSSSLPPALSARWWPGSSTGRPSTGSSSSQSWPTVSSWPWTTSCPITTSPSCPLNWQVSKVRICVWASLILRNWQFAHECINGKMSGFAIIPSHTPQYSTFAEENNLTKIVQSSLQFSFFLHQFIKNISLDLGLLILCIQNI